MSRFKPSGWHSVTPRIVTTDVSGLVGFLNVAFGAQGEIRHGAPAEVKLGDSVLLVSDGGGTREAMPAFLYLYVECVDETFRRALAAGAVSLEEPADMPYGDRRAMVRDSWGNLWQIATYRGR